MDFAPIKEVPFKGGKGNNNILSVFSAVLKGLGTRGVFCLGVANEEIIKFCYYITNAIKHLYLSSQKTRPFDIIKHKTNVENSYIRQVFVWS